MKNNPFRKSLAHAMTTTLCEWKEDMAPQFILMVGLPASGKSTFLANNLTLLYPSIQNIQDMSTINSDIQLRAVQYKSASNDYRILKGLLDSGNEDKMVGFMKMMKYDTYDGKTIEFPFKRRHMETVLSSLDSYWNSMYKPYYASYFFEREKATTTSDALKDKKIHQGGNLTVIDTTGANTKKYLGWLGQAKGRGYTTSVVYVDTPIEYCIARDRYRGQVEGRSVGKTLIMSYSEKIPAAFKVYANSELVDRVVHVVWEGGVIPKDGSFVVKKDKKKYPKKGSKEQVE